MNDYTDILAKLKFIGHIQKDEKINVKYMTKSFNSFFTNLSRRFLYPDNRSNTLVFIIDTISKSFDILNVYMLRESIHEMHITFNDILQAKKGLINLRFTYQEDTIFVCQIDVILSNIDGRVIILRKNNPDIFSELNESELP